MSWVGFPFSKISCLAIASSSQAPCSLPREGPLALGTVPPARHAPRNKACSGGRGAYPLDQRLPSPGSGGGAGTRRHILDHLDRARQEKRPVRQLEKLGVAVVLTPASPPAWLTQNRSTP